MSYQLFKKFEQRQIYGQSGANNAVNESSDSIVCKLKVFVWIKTGISDVK